MGVTGGPIVQRFQNFLKCLDQWIQTRRRQDLNGYFVDSGIRQHPLDHLGKLRDVNRK